MNIILGSVAGSIQASRIPITFVFSQSSESILYSVSSFNTITTNVIDIINTIQGPDTCNYNVSSFNIFNANIFVNTETAIYSVSAILLSA